MERRKIDFSNSAIISEVLQVYYSTWQKTLDTDEYVPPKFNKKIDKIIYKNLRKTLKTELRAYKRQQRSARFKEFKSKIFKKRSKL